MPRYRHTSLPPPYLKRIWLDAEVEVDWSAYPWCLPLFRGRDFELHFDKPVTIIAGENGVGKSTLLEAIGVLAGFDESGGGPGYRAVDNSGALESSGGTLAGALKASWLPKIGPGWFFRAESFFTSRAISTRRRGKAVVRHPISCRIRMARALSASSRNAAAAPGSSCSTSLNRRCRPIASSISFACSIVSSAKGRHRRSSPPIRRS